MVETKTAPQPAAGEQPAQKNQGGGFKALQEAFSGLIKAGPGQFDIGRVNYFLIGCIVLMIVISGLRFSSAWHDLQAEKARHYSAKSAGIEPRGFSEIPAMKGLVYYIGGISGKGIFQRQSKMEQVMTEPVFSSKMADMTANLRLVGISMSADPDAMIEDVHLQKTFFVKAGSMIGDLKVESITKDKVTLKYNKEQFELK